MCQGPEVQEQTSLAVLKESHVSGSQRVRGNCNQTDFGEGDYSHIMLGLVG